MQLTHFVRISSPSHGIDSPVDLMDDDTIMEVESCPATNPLDDDDPELAYNTYLAQRFSQR